MTPRYEEETGGSLYCDVLSPQVMLPVFDIVLLPEFLCDFHDVLLIMIKSKCHVKSYYGDNSHALSYVLLTSR